MGGFSFTCTFGGEDHAFELEEPNPTLHQLGMLLAAATGVELSTLKLVVRKRTIVPGDAPGMTVAEAGARPEAWVPCP
jgi:hypothetical protein